MKSFPAHVTWEGGMQHDNFISLPEPLKCNEVSIAVLNYSLSILPDDPVNLGFMEIVNPFDLTGKKKVKINMEMSHSMLYSTGYYLQTMLSLKNIVYSLVHPEALKRKNQSYDEIEKEFFDKGFEVPHVRVVDNMTSLVVPKNKNCRLFFNNMIDLKHFSSDTEHVYNLAKEMHWAKIVSQPIFGLKLQVNNSLGESHIVKYTKYFDGEDHQVPHLSFTTFNTKEINKIRVQVVDPTGNLLQTIGDCFQEIRAQ